MCHPKTPKKDILTYHMHRAGIVGLFFLVVALRREACFCYSLASEAACAPGQWRGYAVDRGVICAACQEGYFCPNGMDMRMCDEEEEGAPWVGGSRCCPWNTTCADKGHAVTRDCLCRPMQCERGKVLVRAGPSAYECRDDGCSGGCPLGDGEAGLFVRATAGCQCVRSRLGCQAWKNRDDAYECLAV